MEWTDISITVAKRDADTAEAIATMVANGGIYIEDYSDLEQQAWEIAHVDLIEQDLLDKPRDIVIVHMYLAPDENPAEVLPLFEERLKNSGILPLLDRVFISEYLGANKPQLGFFDACFASLPGVKRSESLMLGDSLTSDMRGGKIAGMHTCWYNPNRLPLPTDGTVEYQIHRLPDLLPLLEKL